MNAVEEACGVKYDSHCLVKGRESYVSLRHRTEVGLVCKSRSRIWTYNFESALLFVL